MKNKSFDANSVNVISSLDLAVNLNKSILSHSFNRKEGEKSPTLSPARIYSRICVDEKNRSPSINLEGKNISPVLNANDRILPTSLVLDASSTLKNIPDLESKIDPPSKEKVNEE